MNRRKKPARQIDHCEAEKLSLNLLDEVREVLATAINSLGNQTPPTPESAYLGRAAARTVNVSADAFLSLRSSGRVAASKLLVRPAIEAVFSGAAVMKKPGFLFRKAYSEWLEDKKMFSKDPASEAEAQQALEDMKTAFQKEQPGYPMECKEVKMPDVAEAAGLRPMYDSTYRLYCKFTHGTLRAVEGELDDLTDRHDTPIMTWCVLIILSLLKDHTPATVPSLTPFMRRLSLPK